MEKLSLEELKAAYYDMLVQRQALELAMKKAVELINEKQKSKETAESVGPEKKAR